MPQQTWELTGQYMESCNCDYLCPCIFTNPQAPATHETCTALMVYRIDRGRHGDLMSEVPRERDDADARIALRCLTQDGEAAIHAPVVHEEHDVRTAREPVQHARDARDELQERAFRDAEAAYPCARHRLWPVSRRSA